MQQNEKTTNIEIDIERRNFLEKIFRFIVLVLIGSFIGTLAVNESISTARNGACKKGGICGRCKRKSKCMLPQAQSYRLEHGKRDTNK